MAASSFVLAGFSFILLYCCAESVVPVPVFIWSKDSELSGSTPVLAGHTIRGNDFEEKYLDRLFKSPQLIGVFLQDRLSVDDISHYGDAYSPGNHGATFSNLKFAMETANSSVVLPLVELTSVGVADELVKLIRKKTNGLIREFSHEESRGFDLKEISFDYDKTNVFIFHLLPSSSSTPEEIFAQNDKLIGAITQQISSTSFPYSCILTADAPNEDIQTRHVAEERSHVAHDRLRRAVDASTVDDKAGQCSGKEGLLVDAGCILMYTEGIVFRPNNTDHSFNMAGVGCHFEGKCMITNRSVALKLTMENVEKFELNFFFSIDPSNDEWSCSSTSLDVKGTFGTDHIQDKFLYDCSNLMTAPAKFSYSCTKVTLKNDKSSISFKHFQVQPFNVVKNSTFAYAYDCIGFFTIPIFMGLITAGILLLILFMGVLAMFSLTTMDRFDDPKGPTIHVPTS